MPADNDLLLKKSLNCCGPEPGGQPTHDISCKSTQVCADYDGRFYAWIVDRAISFVLSFLATAGLAFIVLWLFAYSGGRLVYLHPIWDWLFLLSLVCAFVLTSWLYFSLQEIGLRQATPGKRLFKLIVTDLSGNRITFQQATVRYFSKYLSFYLFLMGYLMQPFTARKQALHDILAGTLVVLNPPTAPQAEGQGSAP
jgi:uncharacterized RDD family membrane protein YckC